MGDRGTAMVGWPPEEDLSIPRVAGRPEAQRIAASPRLNLAECEVGSEVGDSAVAVTKYPGRTRSEAWLLVALKQGRHQGRRTATRCQFKVRERHCGTSTAGAMSMPTNIGELTAVSSLARCGRLRLNTRDNITLPPVHIYATNIDNNP